MMACKRPRRLALDAIVYVYDDVGAIIHATSKGSVYDDRQRVRRQPLSNRGMCV